VKQFVQRCEICECLLVMVGMRTGMACSECRGPLYTTRVYEGELRWKSNDGEQKQRLVPNFDRVTFSLQVATF
jgi:hypothetical protein